MENSHKFSDIEESEQPFSSNHDFNMDLIIVNKKREDPVKLSSNATVLDLKKEFARNSKKDINRISFKQEKDGETIRLDDDRKVPLNTLHHILLFS